MKNNSMIAVLFSAALLSGCTESSVKILDYVPINVKEYRGVDAAFGVGVHAYEVAYSMTASHHYFGLVENTARHPESNSRAVAICTEKYSQATAAELGACRDGVIYARRALEHR
jgi:glyoxylate carboligase